MITRESPADLIRSTGVEDLQLSDHLLVTVTTNVSKPRLQKLEVKYRNIKGMDSDAFCHDLSQCSLVQSPPSDVEKLVTLDNETLLTLLDKHAPETKELLPDRPDTAWYNPDAGEAEKASHRAERLSGRVDLESSSNCSGKPTASVLWW